MDITVKRCALILNPQELRYQWKFLAGQDTQEILLRTKDTMRTSVLKQGAHNFGLRNDLNQQMLDWIKPRAQFSLCPIGGQKVRYFNDENISGVM